MNSDICWLSELHHLSKQELDDYMYVSHKRIASKTAEKDEKSGRGSNGMAFIFNSDTVLTNPVEFYGNRIGLLEMDTIAIIGVYMCCNNGPSSRDELKSDLDTIYELMVHLQGKNKEVIIVGDFNVDFSKNNCFTQILIDHMIKTDYISADIEYGPQLIDYTWHSIRYDEDEMPYIISTWVDHLLLPRTTKGVNYVEIIKSSENLGDHNCIRFNVSSTLDIVKVNEYKKKVYQARVNWSNSKVVEEYSKRVELEMAKLDFELTNLNKLTQSSPNIKLALNREHQAINDALVFCKSRLINLYAYTKRPKKKYGIKSKEWWCTTLQEYMEQMRSTFIEYKDSGYDPKFKQPYLEAKRLFRCRKRYNIRIKRDKNLKKLDELFKCDHQTFWKRIKSAQRVKQTIDMPLDQAKNEYEELFTSSFPHNANREKIKEELNEMINDVSNDDEIIIEEETFLF